MFCAVSTRFLGLPVAATPVHGVYRYTFDSPMHFCNIFFMEIVQFAFPRAGRSRPALVPRTRPKHVPPPPEPPSFFPTRFFFAFGFSCT